MEVKIITLNTRGLRNYKKRRKLGNWFNQKKINVAFFQETHSSIADIQFWKTQFRGQCYFAHGSTNSKGVMVIIDYSNLVVKDTIADPNGRYILISADLDDCPYIFLNVYAPNNETEHVSFMNTISNLLVDNCLNPATSVIIGGDFNFVYNVNLDRSGGNPRPWKGSVKVLDEILDAYNLIDIWRVYHGDKKGFTWRRHQPALIQSRLDYFLISDFLQQNVKNIEIVPGLESDHSAVSLILHDDNWKRGPGYWKFNESLLYDETYLATLTNNIKTWINSYSGGDKIAMWEYIKYKIREYTVRYSKDKNKNRKSKVKDLEETVKHLENTYSLTPNNENFNLLEDAKTELEKEYDYITEGSIVRSRARWYEKGEKNNKYFLSLEKINKKKSTIKILKKNDDVILKNAHEIQNEIKAFYVNLYSKREVDNRNVEYFLKEGLPQLLPDQKLICEGPLTQGEVFKVLNALPKNKSPGNDGLTKEFYIAFWPVIGDIVIDALNLGYIQGKFSNSQRQSVITLIDKPGRDKQFLKNWRPISLINFDMKLASKCLARRLEQCLPWLIGHTQSAFVKGRNISDYIRFIDEMFHYTSKNSIPAILLAIDFEKAFDTVSWEFLFKVLSHFNFGESFIKWIKALYCNIECTVMNNGYNTGYFTLERGVRQGDPLSPMLFILVLETLLFSIKSNTDIKGVNISGTEAKESAFADDMTCFLGSFDSASVLFDVLKKFHSCSGLKINTEKCEAIWLGKWRDRKDRPFGVTWPTSSIKIVGIHFSYNTALSQEKTSISQ